MAERKNSAIEKSLPQKQIGKGDKPEYKKQEYRKHERKSIVATTNIQKVSCNLCKEKHRFFKCQQYKDFTPKMKFEFVKGKKLCFNCLKDDHFTGKCSSKNTFFQKGCNERHHTTLHDYFMERKQKRMKEMINRTIKEIHVNKGRKTQNKSKLKTI